MKITQLSILAILTLISAPNHALESDFEEQHCGQQQLSWFQKAVPSGAKTSPGDWPWHAALYQKRFVRRSEQFEYICGGTIIHREFILTAARCVARGFSKKPMNRTDISVEVGRFDLSGPREKHASGHLVSQVVTHRDFDPRFLTNDIALLKLKVPIEFTPYVQPICIWKREENEIDLLPEIRGTVGTVVGWGLTKDYTAGLTTLNMVQLPVAGKVECMKRDREYIGHLLNEKTFCAFVKRGTGLCSDDNGGGMYFKHGGQWYLRGIVSFCSVTDRRRYICTLRRYVGFTDVALHQDWISEQIRLLNTQSSDE